MEIVIVDQDIFVMIKIRFEFEILNVGFFYAGDGMKLNELFALDCAFFPIYQFLLHVSGNFIDVVVDIFDRLIFDNEVGSFFWSDSCDSFDVVATVPHQRKIIKNMLRLEIEFFDESISVRKNLSHRIYREDIRRKQLLEVFVGGIDVDFEIRILLIFACECCDDVICFVARSSKIWNSQFLYYIFGQRYLLLEIILHLFASSFVIFIHFMPDCSDW